MTKSHKKILPCHTLISCMSNIMDRIKANLERTEKRLNRILHPGVPHKVVVWRQCKAKPSRRKLRALFDACVAQRQRIFT
jgi:hypothetical protein